MGEIKQRGRESALITYWADGFLDEVLRRCILLHIEHFSSSDRWHR